MHYYQKNIGDYAKKTGHLTALEHGVYNLIMDGYYDRERGPTLTEATRWARARTEEEKAAVLAVLDEFFVLVGEEYTHGHIIEELAAYKAKAETAQENGKKGGRPPKITQNKPTGLSIGTQSEPSDNPEITGLKANHKPITNNQEPETIKVKSTVPPSGETAEVFSYWQQSMGHPQARLDAKRERAIKARLKDGYTVSQLCKAIDGCKLSPHHMGQNDSRTVYDDVELICRDGPKVDKFIALVERGHGNGMSAGLQQQVSILDEWLNEQGQGAVNV